MNTGNYTAPVVYNYSEINEGKYRTTKHYESIDEVLQSNFNKLSSIINITLNRGFAKSSPNYWLKVRCANKWVILTGLFYSSQYNLYIGDIGKNNCKTNLIIVKETNDFKNVTIYFFNFYTSNIDKVINQFQLFQK